MPTNAESAALAPIWDPIAVRLCFDAGLGASFPLRFGGKIAPSSGQPIDATVTVTALVRDAWQSFGPTKVPLGDCAAIKIGGVEVVLISNRTQALGLDKVHGQWNSVAAADFDGDGDMDLVAGNLGLNTKYKASEKKPLRLYGKDFDGNGSFDVVEAKQPGDTVLPVRGLSCSSQAMPFVRERFPTYDAFAKANLTEIYGGDLASCLELTCHELQHVVVENRGDTFVVAPLPRMTQIAPVFGIGIADFDGDGIQDLVLAQNFFSPEPETGRFDGGLSAFVRGKGGMQFEYVPPKSSGLAIAGDAKSLVLADTDVVVATNDGPVQVLRAIRGQQVLRVALKGPKGNPNAIGARLELREPGGKKHVREITAGSGYLSQSEPCAWFPSAPAGSKLAVRWPDGSTSEHALATTTGEATFAR